MKKILILISFTIIVVCFGLPASCNAEGTELPTIDMNGDSSNSSVNNNKDSHVQSNNKDSSKVPNAGKNTKPHGLPNAIKLVFVVGILIIIGLTVIIVILLRQRTNNSDDRSSILHDINSGKTATFILLSSVKVPGLVYKSLIDKQISIGREMDNTIRIQGDLSVSGHHCVISRKGNLCYINDCNSKNGTFYDGERVCAETPIISGKRIRIGKDEYVLNIRKEGGSEKSD